MSIHKICRCICRMVFHELSVKSTEVVSNLEAAIYYSINTVHTSFILNEELSFLYNNSSKTPPESFLNHDTTSTTSVVFTLLILIVTACGIVSSILLIYGLYRDCKLLLLPWIINITLFTMLDLVYIFYNLVEHALRWNPSVSILITIDFFINCLHVYALLCVISQYQELKAGRGRAMDDQNNRIPNIQYSSQPTATSGLSTTRKPIVYLEHRPTPTQSPSGTCPHTSLAVDDYSPNINSKGPRKSVKFPDHSNSVQNGSQLLEPWTIEVKSPDSRSKGSDTAPLIESIDPILQSNL